MMRWILLLFPYFYILSCDDIFLSCIAEGSTTGIWGLRQTERELLLTNIISSCVAEGRSRWVQRQEKTTICQKKKKMSGWLPYWIHICMSLFFLWRLAFLNFEKSELYHTAKQSDDRGGFPEQLISEKTLLAGFLIVFIQWVWPSSTIKFAETMSAGGPPGRVNEPEGYPCDTPMLLIFHISRNTWYILFVRPNYRQYRNLVLPSIRRCFPEMWCLTYSLFKSFFQSQNWTVNETAFPLFFLPNPRLLFF